MNMSLKTTAFIQMPNEILCHENLSDESFRTLCVLLTFKFKNSPTFPSLKTISLRRNRCRNSILTHIKELKKLGIITYKKRGYSKSNEYSFNFTVGCDNGVSKNKYIPSNEYSTSQFASIDNPSVQDPNNKIINTEINNTQRPPKERQKFMDEIRERYSFLNKK